MRAMLHKIRLVMDYTLADGSTGTIKSDELTDLYAYAGNYLTPQSGEIFRNNKNGYITAEFTANTAFVQNMDKLSAESVMLDPGYGEKIDIKADADVIINSDGSIIVNYEMTGEEPELEEGFELILKTSYSDFEGGINDWQSKAAVIVTESESAEAPEFVAADSTIRYEQGLDEPDVYAFVYAYQIELNDADTTKPLTVKLQYETADGGSWEDVVQYSPRDESIAQRSYSDEEEQGSTWTNYLAYDVGRMFSAEPFVHKMRLVCSYTLTDGTEGEIATTDDADEFNLLYTYNGEYVDIESVEYTGGTLIADFRVNTDLVRHADWRHLTVEEVWINGGSINDPDVTDIADISLIGEDGTFTVTYDDADKAFSPGDRVSVYLTVSYSDFNDRIREWYSYPYTSYTIPESKLVHPEFTLMNIASDSDGMAVEVEIGTILNDLEGGQATACIAVEDRNGEYTDVDDEYGTDKYPGNDSENWASREGYDYVLSPSGYYDVLWGYNYSQANYLRLLAKAHVSYTLSDGVTTGEYYSKAFHIYDGEYMYEASDMHKYEANRRTLTLYVRVLDVIENPEIIEYTNFSMRRTGTAVTIEIEDAPEISYTTIDGATYAVFTYSNLEFSGQWRLAAAASYDEDGGNPWKMSIYMNINIDDIYQ